MSALSSSLRGATLGALVGILVSAWFYAGGVRLAHFP